MNVDGVYKYLKFGGEYAKLRGEEINRIKCFLNLEGISEVDTTCDVILKGELMTINYGAMNGIECEVLRVNNKNKVLVRIESIGQNIMAVIPSKFLSKNQNI